jgi:PD-(D/E)XK nuclease superfamily
MAPKTFKARRSSTFDAASGETFKVSRSKIDLFTECPRCAYLDMKLGVKRPSMPSFTLNNAVDELFKREFDIHRAAATTHPLMKKYGLDAVPLQDERMEEWRDALRRGISYLHTPTNILVRGGIDDVWVNPAGELIIVDYKATSKKVGPSSEDDLYDSYKKQMEVYQWLFRKNGFKVSPTGYFVYANGKADAEAFDGKLEFDIELIPYTGSDTWVEPAIFDLKKMLVSEEIPAAGTSFGGGPCEYCTYRENAGKILMELHTKNKKKK